MNTENNKIAIICITENGKKLALEMQNKLHEGWQAGQPNCAYANHALNT